VEKMPNSSALTGMCAEVRGVRRRGGQARRPKGSRTAATINGGMLHKTNAGAHRPDPGNVSTNDTGTFKREVGEPERC